MRHRKLRRAVGVILSAVLFVGTLAGCSGKGETQPQWRGKLKGEQSYTGEWGACNGSFFGDGCRISSADWQCL